MVIQTQIPLKKYLKLEASQDQAIYKFGIYLLSKDILQHQFKIFLTGTRFYFTVQHGI